MLRIFLNNSLHIVTTVQDQSPILFPEQFDTGFEWLYSQRTTSEQRWWGERRWRRGGWWGGRGVCSPEKWKWKVWKWKSKVWKWMINRASFIFYILSCIGQLVSEAPEKWPSLESNCPIWGRVWNLRFMFMKHELYELYSWTMEFQHFKHSQSLLESTVRLSFSIINSVKSYFLKMEGQTFCQILGG